MTNSKTNNVSTKKPSKNKLKINYSALLCIDLTFIVMCTPVLMSAFILNFIFYDFLASLSESTQTLVTIIYFLVTLIPFMFLIYHKFYIFFGNLYMKFYFFLATKHGKAISRKEFKNIKKVDNTLFGYIKDQKCIGYCFSICFDLLKALKKGKIRFIANKVEDERNYRMHVLYINNNWCFDTDTCKQYSLKYYNKSAKNVIYKDFSYEDIKDLSFYDFKKIIDPKLEIFAKNLNMSYVWKKEADFFV